MTDNIEKNIAGINLEYAKCIIRAKNKTEIIKLGKKYCDIFITVHKMILEGFKSTPPHDNKDKSMKQTKEWISIFNKQKKNTTKEWLDWAKKITDKKMTINIKYKPFDDAFTPEEDKIKKKILKRSTKCSTFEIIDTNKKHLEKKFNFLSDKLKDNHFGRTCIRKKDFSNFEGFIQTNYKITRDTYSDYGPKIIETEIEEYIFFCKKDCTQGICKHYDFVVVYYDKDQAEEELKLDDGNVWSIEPLLLTYRSVNKTFGFNNSNGIISKVQVWDSQKES